MTLITGWGRTAPTGACVVPITSVAGVQAAVWAAREARPRRGLLARGLGRSYGDAAQSAGGVLLDLSALDHVALDAASGTATAGAGASFDTLLRVLLPQGWFVPVTPGTRQVTVAGAIAADVHGKNHHVDGTFGRHVRHLELVTADGAATRPAAGAPDAGDRDAFWATVGGMGLTGVITEATFDLIPVTSSWMRVDTERADDLDALMARMAEGDDSYRYSVAWVDALAGGTRMGRGVLTRGDHAAADELPARERERALRFSPSAGIAAPKHLPGGLLNRWTARAFNEAWLHRAPTRHLGELQPMSTFFHPLDRLRDWNRLYGPRGLVQWQFVVPDASAELIGVALEGLRRIGAPVTLTVLKRLGRANPAPLSFPQPGWTLAVDVPAGTPGLAATLDGLDDRIADAGGRLYLAKDSRMSPSTFARTYPELDRWRTVRDRLDPHRLFVSDLARRLFA